MLYALIADAVLTAHLLFILLVGLGGVLAFFWPRLVFVHIPAVCWGAYVSLSGRICPLTPLEQQLRVAAGQQGYADGFIDHYLVALIYPAGLTRSIQIAIGVAVIGVNVVLYGLLLYRWVCTRRREDRRGRSIQG
ncbi:DUF2784 domain-containing protein [Salinisphaera aquimarina]|uniref:DUF2784 domain-containing protein n=1 Tax=Salinisphaera aquimarina TaxID=2094031 RepID=A0ABV7EUG2_9GAMM